MLVIEIISAITNILVLICLLGGMLALFTPKVFNILSEKTENWLLRKIEKE